MWYPKATWPIWRPHPPARHTWNEAKVTTDGYIDYGSDPEAVTGPGGGGGGGGGVAPPSPSRRQPQPATARAADSQGYLPLNPNATNYKNRATIKAITTDDFDCSTRPVDVSPRGRYAQVNRRYLQRLYSPPRPNPGLQRVRVRKKPKRSALKGVPRADLVGSGGDGGGDDDGLCREATLLFGESFQANATAAYMEHQQHGPPSEGMSASPASRKSIASPASTPSNKSKRKSRFGGISPRRKSKWSKAKRLASFASPLWRGGDEARAAASPGASAGGGGATTNNTAAASTAAAGKGEQGRAGRIASQAAAGPTPTGAQRRATRKSLGAALGEGRPGAHPDAKATRQHLLSRAVVGQNTPHHAVVIGVSRYSDTSIPPCARAARDAQAIGGLLKDHGYTFDFLADGSACLPTKSNILNALQAAVSAVPKAIPEGSQTASAAEKAAPSLLVIYLGRVLCNVESYVHTRAYLQASDSSLSEPDPDLLLEKLFMQSDHNGNRPLFIVDGYPCGLTPPMGASCDVISDGEYRDVSRSRCFSTVCGRGGQGTWFEGRAPLAESQSCSPAPLWGGGMSFYLVEALRYTQLLDTRVLLNSLNLLFELKLQKHGFITDTSASRLQIGDVKVSNAERQRALREKRAAMLSRSNEKLSPEARRFTAVGLIEFSVYARLGLPGSAAWVNIKFTNLRAKADHILRGLSNPLLRCPWAQSVRGGKGQAQNKSSRKPRAGMGRPFQPPHHQPEASSTGDALFFQPAPPPEVRCTLGTPPDAGIPSQISLDTPSGAAPPAAPRRSRVRFGDPASPASPASTTPPATPLLTSLLKGCVRAKPAASPGGGSAVSDDNRVVKELSFDLSAFSLEQSPAASPVLLSPPPRRDGGGGGGDRGDDCSRGSNTPSINAAGEAGGGDAAVCPNDINAHPPSSKAGAGGGSPDDAPLLLRKVNLKVQTGISKGASFVNRIPPSSPGPPPAPEQLDPGLPIGDGCLSIPATTPAGRSQSRCFGSDASGPLSPFPTFREASPSRQGCEDAVDFPVEAGGELQQRILCPDFPDLSDGPGAQGGANLEGTGMDEDDRACEVEEEDDESRSGSGSSSSKGSSDSEWEAAEEVVLPDAEVLRERLEALNTLKWAKMQKEDNLKAEDSMVAESEEDSDVEVDPLGFVDFGNTAEMNRKKMLIPARHGVKHITRCPEVHLILASCTEHRLSSLLQLCLASHTPRHWLSEALGLLLPDMADVLLAEHDPPTPPAAPLQSRKSRTFSMSASMAHSAPPPPPPENPPRPDPRFKAHLSCGHDICIKVAYHHSFDYAVMTAISKWQRCRTPLPCGLSLSGVQLGCSFSLLLTDWEARAVDKFSRFNGFAGLIAVDTLSRDAEADESRHEAAVMIQKIFRATRVRAVVIGTTTISIEEVKERHAIILESKKIVEAAFLEYSTAWIHSHVERERWARCHIVEWEAEDFQLLLLASFRTSSRLAMSLAERKRVLDMEEQARLFLTRRSTALSLMYFTTRFIGISLLLLECRVEEHAAAQAILDDEYRCYLIISNRMRLKLPTQRNFKKVKLGSAISRVMQRGKILRTLGKATSPAAKAQKSVAKSPPGRGLTLPMLGSPADSMSMSMSPRSGGMSPQTRRKRGSARSKRVPPPALKPS